MKFQKWRGYKSRVLFLGNNDNNGLNGNNNLNNNARFVGIGKLTLGIIDSKAKMGELFDKLCDYENLELAFKKARKGKTKKQYVIEFEKDLMRNLLNLSNELKLQTYKPLPLKTFIIRDPKTRKISKSDFRDRVVHHALCNIIGPILDKRFIYDSYANRKGKGTHKAIRRFDYFKRKVSKNNTRKCFVLKADIKHYFETVEHKTLVAIIKGKIIDGSVTRLIETILDNHKTKEDGKGMPLGNLTSQFFANVYLNELDQFVKHKLKARYYIRYVDDFVILHDSRKVLQDYKSRIDDFLKAGLGLELHPDKSRILNLENGVGFLGFRIFFYHRLIRKKNLRKFQTTFAKTTMLCQLGIVEREKAAISLIGWLAYIVHADTYNYRKKLVAVFNSLLPTSKNLVTPFPTSRRSFV